MNSLVVGVGTPVSYTHLDVYKRQESADKSDSGIQTEVMLMNGFDRIKNNGRRS